MMGSGGEEEGHGLAYLLLKAKGSQSLRFQGRAPEGALAEGDRAGWFEAAREGERARGEGAKQTDASPSEPGLSP